MSQNLSIQSVNNYGTVSKIADTQDGRSIYQIISPDGNEAAKVSIPQQDCDTFEKAYSDIIASAPAIQKYAETHSSQEQIDKIKKRAKWTIGISTALGFLIPAAATYKLNKWLQIALTLGGTLAGFVSGSFVAKKMATPPGMETFNKATQSLSKIDVQQVL